MPKKKIEGHTEELVCDLHARGLSPTYIRKELIKQGITLHRYSIEWYLSKPEHLPKIQEAIQKYRSDPLAVDLAHKRIRLTDLNRERVSLIATLQNWKKKDGTVKDKKFNKYLSGLKKLIEIEIIGREEVERRPDLIALFQRIGPYSRVSDVDLKNVEQEITEQLIVIQRKETAPGRIGGGKEREETPHTRESA